MALEHVTTMQDDAEKRVLSQYRNKPRVVGLVRGLAGAVQTVEDAWWALLNAVALGSATGIWLDYLGRIVGEPRDGEADDAVYRRYVRARILANKSSGTVEDLIAVTRLVVPTGLNFLIVDQFPAGLLFDLADQDLVPGFTDAVVLRLQKLLNATRAGGVNLQVIWPASQDTQFSFADSDGMEDSDDQGFADAADPLTYGGQLAGVINP